jgi:hypothetical protein
MILRDRYELGLPATASDTEHAIAGTPPAHLIAHLGNFTGEFNSGNVLWVTRRRRITPEALQDVRTIQSGRTHTDPDAIKSWRRGVRDFADFETFNTAE